MTVIPMTSTTYTEWQKAAHFPPRLPAGMGSVEVLYCVLALQEWAGWSSQAGGVQGERRGLLPAASPLTQATLSDVLQERDRSRAQTQGDILNSGTGNPSADRW